MPTLKQKKAFKEMVETGRTKGEAMVNAGYSKNTAKAPTKLTESKGWKELLEKHIPDSKLTKVLDEGLGAGKRVFKNNNETKEIEDMGIEPDYAVRHKYLETGLKLKDKFPSDKIDHTSDGKPIQPTVIFIPSPHDSNE